MKRILAIISFLLPFIYAGVSFAGDVSVVVSIYPLMDISRQVGGEMVDVNFIVPPGASPHVFEPTPSDMIKIHNARVFVVIGAGFEFWADKAIRSAGRPGLRVIRLSEGVKLLKHVHLNKDKGHGEEGFADPHIWLDPLLVKEMVDKIALVLAEVDPAHKKYYLERAEAYKKELNILHLLISESVKNFGTKEYVTFHPAWNYFSKRYGLRVAGIIEESPGKEASPKHIADIIREVKKSRAKIVFAEPQFNPKTAEVVAKESGAKVLFLDPLGTPSIKGRDTYIGLMKYNLSILEKAMR